MDEMVQDILNMSKMNQTLRITMPNTQRPRQNDTANETFVSERLHSDCASDCDIQSEMDYIEKYRQEDDEEYLRVSVML